MRETPEGKFRHEQVMYVDRCRRIHDFRKPTIAAVQGKCVAAGLMLACMCDLIVAADDASFSNPVLRMTGAGVELLVEPWELGIRKAKEFLLAAEELDAAEAWRLGLVNKVVPRAELGTRTMELAQRVALVPPVTAQVVKDSLNHVGELMGKGASWRYHFMAHQWAHNTATALYALEQRKQMGSMKEVFAARDRGDAAPDGGLTPDMARPLEGLRVIDVGTRIGAPFCAGLLGEWGAEVVKVEQPAHRRLHARHRALRRRLLAVLGRGGTRAQERHLRPARRPRARTSSAGWRRPPTWCARTSAPGPWRSGAWAPPTLDPRLVFVRISAFGQDGPYAGRPGLDRLGVAYGGLLHLTGEAGPTTGAAGGDRGRLPHRRVRGRGGPGRAVPARRGTGRAGPTGAGAR